jgi:hypothetical protein
LRRFGKGPDFLNRADADAVSFSESAVHSTGFRDSHFGAVNQSRNIGRIGVAIAYEAATPSGFVNRGSKGVTASCLIRQLTNGLDLHPRATATLGQANQSSVGHVPTATQKKKVSAL